MYINDITYALGSRVVSLESSEIENDVIYFSEKNALIEAGFKQHRVCTHEQSAYDLAVEAITKLQAINADLDTVDVILYATCLTQNGNLGSSELFSTTKDVKHLMDFPISHLQADFGLDKAFLMGLNQTACTSLLGAIRVGNALLKAEDGLSSILCLTADRFPEGAIYEQGYNVISDGAVACILNQEQGAFKILACHQISNGAMAQASDEETAGFYFNYTYKLLHESVHRAGLDFAQVDWIVPQNVNIKAWQVLSSLLRFDMEQILMLSRETVAHCISGDNLINLQLAYEQGYFKPGDIMLMPMAGFGLNWSCIVLEKT